MARVKCELPDVRILAASIPGLSMRLMAYHAIL